MLIANAIGYAWLGHLSDVYFNTFTDIDMRLFNIIVLRLYSIMENQLLVAIPMFILMGVMLDKSGIAQSMIHSLQRLFGKLHGGLALTVAFVGILLAASTGIIGASVVLLTLLTLPIMKQQGYSKTTSLRIIAASRTLGILIPPSIMLVLMADILAISVGDLFKAALLIGLLLGSSYVFYIIIIGIIRPGWMPLSENEHKPFNLAFIIEVIQTVLPPLLLIFLVLGSIFYGIATPTEASGLGAFGAMALALVRKKLTIPNFLQSQTKTYRTLSYIFSIVIAATIFSLVLRLLGGG